MDKVYLSYDSIHLLTKNLANKIYESNFKPDCIIAIGTGGFIPARILKTFIDIPVLTVNVSHYKDTIKTDKINIIQNIYKNSLEHSLIYNKNVLIIDELDDTRSTLLYVSNLIKDLEPNSIGVGVLHSKIKNKTGQFDKDVYFFYSEKVPDKWIVYPWEITSVLEQKKRLGLF